MKKTLLIIVAIFLVFTTKASHMLGGEITWECQANGNYIFSMTIYRDCQGINMIYQNEAIDIVGSPLPTNGVTSIILKPDSTRWLNSNMGDLSPECTNSYGNSISCANRDNGTVQAHYYRSDPITLTGVPPTSGWSFYWVAPCCRSGNVENINSTGQMLLRSIMFPDANSTPVDICFDSSPEFVDIPQVVLCRSSLQKYKHVVFDENEDSISYAWNTPINTPISSPNPLAYRVGYSQNNLMPDQSFDSLNIPITLNPVSGDISFLVNSSFSSVDRYIQPLNVSSWRDGVEIARVSREVLFTIIDCPPFPNLNENFAPTFATNFTQDIDGVYRDTVIAGTLIDELMQVSDFDSSGVGSNFQIIEMIPFGQSFSGDFSQNGPCDSTKSCAYLDAAPFLNTSGTPAYYRFLGVTSINTRFKWQTDCSSLTDSLGTKTHYFSFKYFDDHCPVPQIAYQTLAITVLPSSQPCSLLTSTVNREELKDRVKLYPNPTRGNFSIQLGQITDQIEVQIRTIQGKLVQHNTYSNQSQIDLEVNGEVGVYFVQLIDTNGEQVIMKVIKQ